MPRAVGVGLTILAAWMLLPLGAAPPGPAAEPLRQQLDLLGVPAWHERDWRGQGVKVAVLDTGFRDYRQLLGRGLPEHVVVRSFRPDQDLEARDSQHGVLCGQVVHAIAPAAELLLANWDTEDPSTFLAAVRWAKSQGARIISCSVILPSWSDGEGGGAVHAQLDQLLGDDLLFFASAGNIAQRHWQGPVHAGAGGFHQWRPGNPVNRLVPWSSERVSVELYGPIEGRGELLVYEAEGALLVGRCPLHIEKHGRQSSARATVRFDPLPQRSYQVCFKVPNDAPRGTFHLAVLAGTLEHSEAKGSIPFPGDGARVLAVGAVDRGGQRQAYSSCGPTARRATPDFAAAVPFPSGVRGRPFSGTSAAAPQAAGLAALLWSRHAEWPATDVAALLRAAACDVGPAGHDCETGFGLVRLPTP
jgi:subtilisin family serine protease